MGDRPTLRCISCAFETWEEPMVSALGGSPQVTHAGDLCPWCVDGHFEHIPEPTATDEMRDAAAQGLTDRLIP